MQLTKETVLLIIAGIVGVSLLTTWFTGSLDSDLSQLVIRVDEDTKVTVIGSGQNNANIVGTIHNNSPVLVNVTSVSLFDGTTNTVLSLGIVRTQQIEPYGSTAIRGILTAVEGQVLSYDTTLTDTDALAAGAVIPAGQTAYIKLRSGQEISVTFDLGTDDGKTDVVSTTLRTR